MQKATIDQPAYNQHGALLIKTSITTQGVISLYVTAGAGRIDTLSKAFTDRQAAAAFYRHISQAAEQGKQIHQIEWEVAALIEAGTAIDVEQVAEAINADWDARDAKRETAREKLAADVADITATPYRRVRNTRTQVFRQALNAVQARAIRNHRDGVVYAEDGVSWLTLRALVDKGFGTPVRIPGRQIITSVRLNELGMTVADEPAEAVA